MTTAATVDTLTLPSDEVQRIQGMIDNAKVFFDQPSKLLSMPPKRAADYFKYKITIETKGKQDTIETNDITMPSELRPLINYLTENVRKKQ